MFLYNLLRSGSSISTIIVAVVALAIAATFSIIMHECAHGVAAGWCGDKTAKYAGRITLNPVKHVDVKGLLMLLLFGFGWAKPVPINPSNFKNRKKGMILTSIAGVTTNLILAGVFLLIMYLVAPSIVYIFPNDAGIVNVLKEFCFYLLLFFIQINMMLALFNLLPIYPLDGFRLLNEFLPNGNKFSDFMFRYGGFVLLGLLLFSYVCDFFGLWFLDIFGMFSRLITSLINLVLP